MATLETEHQAYSIVVLGDFNPSIFQPLWFSLNDLLPEVETKNADIEIIHKQFASFSIGKIKVQVDGSRLSLATVESPQLPILRDLAIGTLSVLEHTPLKAIGLNRDMMFLVETDKALREVSDKLVPANNWGQVFDRPGMRRVIVDGHRSGCRADRLQIRVEPSATRGVLIAVNQHYQLENEQCVEVRDRHNEAIRILENDWSSFVGYAHEAAEKLLDLSPAS